MPDTSFNRCKQSFVLDFLKPTANRLSVVNGDTANTFEIKLTCDDQPITLDANLHMIVAVFLRADGQIYTQDKNGGLSFTSDGIVTIDLYPTSYRTGPNVLTLQVYKRASTDTDTYDLRQTTYEQRFNGRVDPVTSDPESAFPQLPLIAELIEEVRDVLDDTPQEAADAANAAATAATNAAAAANAAKLLADAATELANAAAARAEAAIDSIEQLILADGAVTTAKLAAKAVTTAKIDDKAVGTGQIGDKAVGTGQIDDKAVGAGQLDDGAVGTGQIADGSVTAAKLAAAVAQGLHPNIMKSLWTGTWSQGSITVPGITDYTLFIVRMSGQATNILAMHGGDSGTYFRGIGGYTRFAGQAYKETFYLLAARRSGNTLTMEYPGACHSYTVDNRTEMTVTEIIGVI